MSNNKALNVNYEDLPNLCQTDEDIKFLLDDIFELGQYPYRNKDLNYQKYFHNNCHENECGSRCLITQLRKDKNNIYQRLIKLSEAASKKDIAKALVVNVGEIQKFAILIYLSGLYRLTITGSQGSDWDWQRLKARDLKISDDPNYFMELPRTDWSSSLIIETDTYYKIEPIIFNKCIEEVQFKITNENLTDTACFERIKYGDIELIPEEGSLQIDWWENNFPVFNINQLNLSYKDNTLKCTGSGLSNFQLTISDDIDSCEIQFKKINAHLICQNTNANIISEHCQFKSITWQNCHFATIPYFSDHCLIQQEVHVDSQTFKNIEHTGKELEYTRLAEFLNRSKAYIEAQKLHKHYLQAKAKNEPQLKFLVFFYKKINGCGTSLLKPVGIIIGIFLLTAIFYGWDAFLGILPLGIFKQEVDLVHFNAIAQLIYHILIFVSYIMYFLIALQIRKLLKLKE